MSEHDDDRVSAAYRGLPREEPSASVDAAILAASRRAAAPARHARNWRVPLSIAAVVMLAAGLTFHMRNEEPGIELQEPGVRNAPPPAAPAPPQQSQPQAAPEAAASAVQQAPPPAAEKRKRESVAQPLQKVAPATPAPFPAESARKEAAPAVEEKRAAPQTALPAAAPAAPPPAAATITTPSRAQSAPMPAPSMMAPSPEKQEAAASGAAAGSMAADSVSAQSNVAREKERTDTPERELERIAQLRAEGKDADADKALEEFRRRHPGYSIAPALWERVKPR